MKVFEYTAPPLWKESNRPFEINLTDPDIYFANQLLYNISVSIHNAGGYGESISIVGKAPDSVNVFNVRADSHSSLEVMSRMVVKVVRKHWDIIYHGAKPDSSTRQNSSNISVTMVECPRLDVHSPQMICIVLAYLMMSAICVILPFLSTAQAKRESRYVTAIAQCTKMISNNEGEAAAIRIFIGRSIRRDRIHLKQRLSPLLKSTLDISERKLLQRPYEFRLSL